MRLVKGANVDFSVYDTSLNLIQHVTTPDTFAQNIDSIWLGNNLADDLIDLYNMRFDDLVVDYTNATFPLLPKQSLATTTAVTSSANPSGPGQSVTLTATVSSTGGTPTG